MTDFFINFCYFIRNFLLTLLTSLQLFLNFCYLLLPLGADFLLTFCYFNKHFLLTFDSKWRIFIAFRIYRLCQWELPNQATKCGFHFQTAWCKMKKSHNQLHKTICYIPVYLHIHLDHQLGLNQSIRVELKLYQALQLELDWNPVTNLC